MCIMYVCMHMYIHMHISLFLDHTPSYLRNRFSLNSFAIGYKWWTDELAESIHLHHLCTGDEIHAAFSHGF